MADSRETLNILSVWPRSLWERKQSPSRRFCLRAMARRPDVVLHQTGPGFDDWDDNASGMVNIRKIMPDCHAVISYKSAGGCEFGMIHGISALARQILIVETFNEAWSGDKEVGGVLHPGANTVVDYARQAHLGLLIYHHANDLSRIEAAAEFGCRLAHIPHGADPMFLEESRPWSERHGVLLTGALNEQHYPLRCRMARLIREGRIDGAYFPRPPNYTRSVEESDALVRQYARALGSCRVKLGCSSRWRYALQHYSEAALAGCAHVADMPDGIADDFCGMVMPFGPDISDNNLIEHIQCVERFAAPIGERSQQVAKAHYTTDHYAAKLVAEIRASLATR